MLYVVGNSCVDDISAGELGVKWLVHSGGETSESCGVLLSGAAMKFSGRAERLLETSDLDLLHATSVVSSCMMMIMMVMMIIVVMMIMMMM